MNRRTRVALQLAVSIGLIGAAAMFTSAEVITVRASAQVPLYDPSTVAGPWGTVLKTVGTLQAGESLNVVGCDDRKSDIDIQVLFQGQVAVLGGRAGEFRLFRRDARIWDPNATRSCRGFFGASSEDA